jgi:hypothetical protein
MLRLVRQLNSILDSLTDLLDRQVWATVSDKEMLDQARLELAWNGLTLAMPPVVFFGRLAVTRVRPYWRERALTSPAVADWLSSLGFECVNLLKEAQRIDREIRELAANSGHGFVTVEGRGF